MKTINKYNIRLIFCFLLTIVVAVSCDSAQFSSQSGESEGIGIEKMGTLDIKPGVLYMVSYDQITASYSTRLPARLIKPHENKNFVLRNYERVHKTFMVDRDGFIHITTEWLDGNADVNMPLDLYNRTSHLRPANGKGYKPVVRSELSNGYIKYFSRDGKVLHKYAVDKANFKVDPARFNEILSNSRNGKDINMRISQNLRFLRQQEINFRRIDSNFAELSQTVSSGSEVARQKQLLDLRLGRVIKSVALRADGKVLNKVFMDYKKTEGLPVLKNSMTKNFGGRNGEWVVTNRTVVNRENIEVFIH